MAAMGRPESLFDSYDLSGGIRAEMGGAQVRRGNDDFSGRYLVDGEDPNDVCLRWGEWLA